MARRKNKKQEEALQQLGLVPGAEQQPPTPEGEQSGADQPADAQEAPDLGGAEFALTAPPAAVGSILARRYQVELAGLPDVAAVKAPVIAINETEAFEAFKKRHGIIRTKHRPTITDLGPAEVPAE